MENTDIAPTSTNSFSSYFTSGSIHIAAEVIALTGVVAYFYTKNNTLTNNITELARRLEEHEATLQRHEEILKKIVSSMGGVKKQPSRPTPPLVPQKSMPIFPGMDTDLFAMFSPPPPPPPVHQRESIVEVKDEEEDLDTELKDEISQLK